MIKVLYANGCSMTEGAELGNIQFKFDEKWYGPNTSRGNENVSQAQAEHMELHAYPNLLKDKLKIPLQINNAKSGSSNRRISRTTIADLEELCQTYDPSEIFVKIGFSSADRYEYMNGKHFAQIVPSTLRAKPNQFQKLPKDVYAYLEARTDIGNYSLLEVLTQHFLEVLVLKQYLEAKGIKYLFSYGVINIFSREYSAGEIDEATNDSVLQSLYKLLEYNDVTKWVVDVWRPTCFKEYILHTYEFCFREYVAKRKLFTGNGGHPLEHAHEAWANHLSEYIKKNNIL